MLNLQPKKPECLLYSFYKTYRT